MQVEFERFYKNMQADLQINFGHYHRSDAETGAIQDKLNQLDEKLRNRFEDELLGLGPIKKLVEDDEISEIIINGPQHIYCEKEGSIFKCEDQFLSLISYRNFIERLCQASGTQFNLEHPHASGQWDQFRLQIVSPPLVDKYPHITLRRHPLEAWTLDQFESMDFLNQPQASKLKELVEQRKNFLIIGATGTGKTSLLNACIQFCKQNERVVCIEDTSELKLSNPLSLKLLTRFDCQGQLPDVDQAQLLKHALRMRPHRIVMGEVRGNEAKDLLMAFATGHGGGMASLHADSAAQALIRLEMLIQMGAPQWSVKAIRNLIYLSIDSIVCLEQKNGHRRVKDIRRLASLEENGFLLESILG